MGNPYFGENSQQNKKGGSGARFSKPAGTPSMPYRCPPWPKAPGKTGPNRNTMPEAEKIEQFPKSEGI